MDSKCRTYSISCTNCNLSQLCIPFSLDNDELQVVDDVIDRKKPFHKGDTLFAANSPLMSLFAVRSGSFKSYLIDDQGVAQVTGFHLPGDVIGFDALSSQHHQTYCSALETSMVCEIPIDVMDDLADKMPNLRRQINRLMSNEISHDQSMFMQLNKRTAEERIDRFLMDLAQRFSQRNLSKHSFRLTMTRADIGNYLGLTVETVSRVLSKLQKQGKITVNGKLIELNDLDNVMSK